MTVDQLFEGTTPRKTVWTKRGDDLSKREVQCPSSSVNPRVKFEKVKAQ